MMEFMGIYLLIGVCFSVFIVDAGRVTIQDLEIKGASHFFWLIFWCLLWPLGCVGVLVFFVYYLRHPDKKSSFEMSDKNSSAKKSARADTSGPSCAAKNDDCLECPGVECRARIRFLDAGLSGSRAGKEYAAQLRKKLKIEYK
jgi:hypothetical protein